MGLRILPVFSIELHIRYIEILKKIKKLKLNNSKLAYNQFQLNIGLDSKGTKVATPILVKFKKFKILF